MKSLFTNVLLDYTMYIILKRIYDVNKLYTNLSKKEIKKLLGLCKKTYISLLTTKCTNNVMV